MNYPEVPRDASAEEYRMWTIMYFHGVRTEEECDLLYDVESGFVRRPSSILFPCPCDRCRQSHTPPGALY